MLFCELGAGCCFCHNRHHSTLMVIALSHTEVMVGGKEIVLTCENLWFQENQDALLQCVMHDVGFSHDRPIAACILYKSLLQWRSFEAERTNVFDRIIQTIGTAIEVRFASSDSINKFLFQLFQSSVEFLLFSISSYCRLLYLCWIYLTLSV